MARPDKPHSGARERRALSVVLNGRPPRARAGRFPTRAHRQLPRGPAGPYLLGALEANLADGLVVLVLVPGALVATAAAAAAAAAAHRARLGLVAAAPPLALRLPGAALPRRCLRDRRLRRAPRTFPGVPGRAQLLAGRRQGRRRRRQLVRAPAPRDHRQLVRPRGALGGRGQRRRVTGGGGDRGRLSRGRLGVPALRPAAPAAAVAALKAHSGAAAALPPARPGWGRR